jgi:hypothetical protein
MELVASANSSIAMEGCCLMRMGTACVVSPFMQLLCSFRIGSVSHTACNELRANSHPKRAGMLRAHIARLVESSEPHSGSCFVLVRPRNETRTGRAGLMLLVMSHNDDAWS